MQLDIKKIFDHKKTLLLRGETGVGKTCYAKELHQSFANEEDFIYLNLATLSDDLFTSQLFGYKKGAFTGADKDSIGFVEMASKGTLFLDEISEISLAQQQKLLSLLEEQIFYPIGSTKAHHFYGRIILATHKDLKKLVEKKLFREDLYYRICRFEVWLPPLRMQKNKILESLFPFKSRFENSLFEYMTSEYAWPGNYRELSNFIDYLTYSDEHKKLSAPDLPRWLSLSDSKYIGSEREKLEDFIKSLAAMNYYCALELFERSFLTASMNYYEGRLNYASQQLNLSKSTLIAKLKKYGINTLKIKAMSQERKSGIGHAA